MDVVEWFRVRPLFFDIVYLEPHIGGHAGHLNISSDKMGLGLHLICKSDFQLLLRRREIDTQNLET